MRVFVAGATGFIGRATCRALAAAGHEVWGLARSAEKARALAEDRVRPVLGTLDTPLSYLQSAGQPEAVVHLAATWFTGLETIEQARGIAARILEWTRGLARLALDSSSRIFAFGGSNARTGKGGRPEAVGYDRLLEPAQTYLESLAPDLRLAVLLPGWVYGARSWFPEMVQEVRAGRTSHLVDDGSARLGYVHVDDVGEAFRLAVENGAAGARYNVVDEEPLTARQFVEATARTMSSPMPRGVTREEAARERGEVYAEALTCSVDLDLGSIRRDLAWRPRYPSGREGIPPVLRSLGL